MEGRHFDSACSAALADLLQNDLKEKCLCWTEAADRYLKDLFRVVLSAGSLVVMFNDMLFAGPGSCQNDEAGGVLAT